MAAVTGGIAFCGARANRRRHGRVTSKRFWEIVSKLMRRLLRRCRRGEIIYRERENGNETRVMVMIVESNQCATVRNNDGDGNNNNTTVELDFPVLC